MAVCLFFDSHLKAVWKELHSTLSNVRSLHTSFTMICARGFRSVNWDVRWYLILLVIFVHHMNSVTFSVGQHGKFRLAPYTPLSSYRIWSANKSASTLSHSYFFIGRTSRYTCPLDHFTHTSMLSHHYFFRSRYVLTKSQSPSVL
jgi:hypothetical protein